MTTDRYGTIGRHGETARRGATRRYGAMLLAAATLVGCAGTPPGTDSSSLDLVVAGELDGYARLLRESGRGDEAGEMAAHAEKLREADRVHREVDRAFREGRGYETSFYLGFVPDRTLQAYATELRRHGQTARAEEVSALATRYREEQTEAIEELRRRARSRRP